LEQTLIKAWIVDGCIFFITLKGLLTLDIYIEVLFVQLYNTFLVQTSIELFTNSSNGEDNTNLLMFEELTSGTLAKKLHGQGESTNLKTNVSHTDLVVVDSLNF
jgi:hypothetical protein